MPRDRNAQPAIDDRVRIEHMLKAARDLRKYTAGRSRAELEDDSMLMRAVLHAIQEIGEAAANTSDAGRARARACPGARLSQ